MYAERRGWLCSDMERTMDKDPLITNGVSVEPLWVPSETGTAGLDPAELAALPEAVRTAQRLQGARGAGYSAVADAITYGDNQALAHAGQRAPGLVSATDAEVARFSAPDTTAQTTIYPEAIMAELNLGLFLQRVFERQQLLTSPFGVEVAGHLIAASQADGTDAGSFSKGAVEAGIRTVMYFDRTAAAQVA